MYMRCISILIPAYNEAEVLNILYERLCSVAEKIKNYSFEFLFVNDGSKDDTLIIIQNLSIIDPRISYIDLSRNFGKEIAMLAGFDYVKGDAVIILDADLQDPPELIPKMISYWEQGFDDVYAKRKSRDGETWFKKWSSNTYYKVLEKISNVPIQRDTGDFRLLDRKCIDAIKKIRENQRYTKGIFSWIGFKKKEILFDRDARIAGKTKWNYRNLVELAIDGITSSTVAPLRIASYTGLIISVLSFIFMMYIVVKTILFGGSVPGYPSLMSVILFLGGIQLLSLGIIGEYLGKIFYETKDRPTYFIQEYHQSEVILVETSNKKEDNTYKHYVKS